MRRQVVAHKRVVTVAHAYSGIGARPNVLTGVHPSVCLLEALGKPATANRLTIELQNAKQTTGISRRLIEMED